MALLVNFTIGNFRPVPQKECIRYRERSVRENNEAREDRDSVRRMDEARSAEVS